MADVEALMEHKFCLTRIVFCFCCCVGSYLVLIKMLWRLQLLLCQLPGIMLTVAVDPEMLKSTGSSSVLASHSKPLVCVLLFTSHTSLSDFIIKMYQFKLPELHSQCTIALLQQHINSRLIWELLFLLKP